MAVLGCLASAGGRALRPRRHDRPRHRPTGLTPEEVKLMWDTAPPRIPFTPGRRAALLRRYACPGLADAVQLGAHLFAAHGGQADGNAFFSHRSGSLNSSMKCLTF